MIHDTLANAGGYLSLSPRLKVAMEFLQRPETAVLPVGRYELGGPNLFALVQEYTTRCPEETFWETHRKFIDVQYMIRGAEAIGWSPKETMKLKKDYDSEKDVFVWDGKGDTILLNAGFFVIFFPHDAHMGGLLIGSPQPVRKIVVKVGVE